jgi:hypothetical protein
MGVRFGARSRKLLWAIRQAVNNTRPEAGVRLKVHASISLLAAENSASLILSPLVSPYKA